MFNSQHNGEVITAAISGFCRYAETIEIECVLINFFLSAADVDKQVAFSTTKIPKLQFESNPYRPT